VRKRQIAAFSSIEKRGGLALALALLPLSVALADLCKAIPDRGCLPAYLRRGATSNAAHGVIEPTTWLVSPRRLKQVA
jgi:hypothetical protein